MKKLVSVYSQLRGKGSTIIHGKQSGKFNLLLTLLMLSIINLAPSLIPPIIKLIGAPVISHNAFITTFTIPIIALKNFLIGSKS